MLEDLEWAITSLREVDETIASLKECPLPVEIQFGCNEVRISEDTASKIKVLLLEDRKRYREEVKRELVWTMEQLKLELQDE